MKKIFALSIALCSQLAFAGGPWIDTWDDDEPSGGRNLQDPSIPYKTVWLLGSEAYDWNNDGVPDDTRFERTMRRITYRDGITNQWNSFNLPSWFDEAWPVLYQEGTNNRTTKWNQPAPPPSQISKGMVFARFNDSTGVIEYKWVNPHNRTVSNEFTDTVALTQWVFDYIQDWIDNVMNRTYVGNCETMEGSTWDTVFPTYDPDCSDAWMTVWWYGKMGNGESIPIVSCADVLPVEGLPNVYIAHFEPVNPPPGIHAVSYGSGFYSEPINTCILVE